MKESYGGFLPLEFPKNNINKLDGIVCLQSARAALKYFIENSNVKKIWLPMYTCDALISVFHDTKIELCFYNISRDFTILNEIHLDELELLVYVNYFGLNDHNSRLLIDKYGCKKVIIDNSQAFFSSVNESIAIIYSARKFFGVPDGGFLKTNELLNTPLGESDLSIRNVQHLIERHVGDRELAYTHFLSSEQYFEDTSPKKTSLLTESILNSIDWNEVSRIRIHNFNTLDNKLSKYNKLKFKMETAPLCYPFLSEKKISKKKLAEMSIFLPTYWQDSLNRKINSFEISLVEDCLFLPIDQRYDENDMEHISQCVLNMIFQD